MRRVMIMLTVTAVALSGTVAGFQLKTPTDWKWRTDAPASVSESGSSLAANEWYYVAMPPGWHVTTRPGVLLYHPAHQGRGNWSLQSEIFLFPGDNQEEYGVFVGGRALDQDSVAPEYTAFVVRRDGQAAILKRSGTTTTPLVNWMANRAVLPHPGGDDTVKNVLKVDIGARDIIFSANDQEIVRMPRADVVTDGALGLRVGRSVNLHVSTLDVTYKLAPTPVKK